MCLDFLWDLWTINIMSRVRHGNIENLIDEMSSSISEIDVGE